MNIMEMKHRAKLQEWSEKTAPFGSAGHFSGYLSATRSSPKKNMKKITSVFLKPYCALVTTFRIFR
ncbi:MAG: hypothetical protein IKI84_03280 [Clostridia bacterium]|nr:hypothetical protein [Clostridia bacterium]